MNVSQPRDYKLIVEKDVQISTRDGAILYADVFRPDGNTEAFMLAASKHKKLRIHSGTHFHAFYSEEGRMDQLRWFDYWLKGIDTGIMAEPPVKLEIRTAAVKGGMSSASKTSGRSPERSGAR